MTAHMPSAPNRPKASVGFQFHPEVEAAKSETLVALARKIVPLHVEHNGKVLAYPAGTTDILDQDCFWRNAEDEAKLIPVSGLYPVLKVPTTHFVNLETLLYHPTVAEILAQIAGHAELLRQSGHDIVAFSTRPAKGGNDALRSIRQRGQEIPIYDGETTLYAGVLPERVAKRPVVICRGEIFTEVTPAP